MTHRFGVFRLFIVFFLAMAVADDARAIEADKAKAFIRELGDKALGVVKADHLPKSERSRQLRELLRENFDVRTIGNFALGVHRRRATQEQRADYLGAFEDYIVFTYASRLGKFAGESFAVTGTRPAGSSKTDIFVMTDVMRPGKETIPVIWRVREFEGEVQIIDVEIEGTSQILTYKQEFASVIKRRGEGVAGLIAELKDKNATLQATIASN